jgi:PIN domain nuclease of toxin-antitoxin system
MPPSSTEASRHRGPVPSTGFRWIVAVIERYDLREVPLHPTVACSAAALPPVHRDPFDRGDAALAQAHGLAVLTSDENIGNTQA